MAPTSVSAPPATRGAKRKRAGDAPEEGGDGDGGGGGVMPASRPTKQLKGAGVHGPDMKHALLAQYYPKTQSLRAYVLAKLPASSRIRRKRIASVGSPPGSSGRSLSDAEKALGRLLDTAIVARHDEAERPRPDNRWETLASHSQNADDSHVTLSDGAGKAFFSLPEVRCACLAGTDETEPAPRC